MALFQRFAKKGFAQEDYDAVTRRGLESSEDLAGAFINLGEADALGVGAAWQLARRDARAFAYAAGKQLSAAVSSLDHIPAAGSSGGGGHAPAAVCSGGGGAAVCSPGGAGGAPTVVAAVCSAAEGAARIAPRSQKAYRGRRHASHVLGHRQKHRLAGEVPAAFRHLQRRVFALPIEDDVREAPPRSCR